MHEIDFSKDIEILKYILEQIGDIEKFCDGFDEEMFLRNDLVKNASLMKLLVLGEYSSHIDNRLKNRFSEGQWQFIKQARNYYAHAYRGIDWIKVWETINNAVPDLKVKIENNIQLLEKVNN